MTQPSCQACGHDLSDTAAVCPQCGHAVADFTKAGKTAKADKNTQLIGVVVMCAGVVSCAGDEGAAVSLIAGSGLFIVGSFVYYLPRLRARWQKNAARAKSQRR